MPAMLVVYFCEEDGRVPALEAILAWARRDRRIAAKCIDRIELLAKLGHELRRPDADYLRDGIHELRATYGKTHYRVLYFFSGGRAVLACAVAKEGAVPERDIDLAVRYRDVYERSPGAHTYRENGGDEGDG
jgi:phage-related protein